MSIITARPSRPALNHTIDNEFYAVLSFAPPAVPEKARAPLTLSVVLDRSGSMAQESKMEYARRSLIKLVDHLKDEDQLSLVVFDDDVETLARHETMTAEGKEKLRALIKGIGPTSCTNLSGGLIEGLTHVTAALTSRTGSVPRTLLFTDGLANRGEARPDELVTLITKLRGQCGISTFGYGRDYNKDLLLALAMQGGHYYIDTPDKILSAFGTELGGLISTYAQAVTVYAKGGEDTEVLEVLNDLTVKEETPGTYLVQSEDLLAEQPYHIAFRLRSKARQNVFPRDFSVLSLTVKYLDLVTGTHVEEQVSAKVRFVKPGEEAEEDKDVMRLVAQQQVAQAQAQAIHYANAGNYLGAREVMYRAASAASAYSPELEAMAIGTVALVGDEGTYKGGGGQSVNSVRKVLARNRGATKSMKLGEVEMHNLYSSPLEQRTSRSFEGPNVTVTPAPATPPPAGAGPATPAAPAAPAAPTVVKTKKRTW